MSGYITDRDPHDEQPESIGDVISRAFTAYQRHESRIDVQLVLAPVSDSEPLWATEGEYSEELDRRLSAAVTEAHSLHWTHFWTCACGVDRLNLAWVKCERCGERAPAFDKPE